VKRVTHRARAVARAAIGSRNRLTSRSLGRTIAYRFTMSDRLSSPTVEEPPASTDRRARRRAAKRARIIAEAWSLAHRDGLAGLSLRDLADRVDLQQPSLYAYFESKLDLYGSMFQDGQQQLLDRFLAREPLADPREELVAIVEDLVRFSSEDAVRHQLLFQRTIPGFEPSDAAMEPARAFFELMAERLRAAGVEGQSEVDLFSAVVSGLAHQQVANDPGGDRWVGLARRVVETLIVDIDRRSAHPSTLDHPTTRRTK
jgi:AcrR family transcriptional regulator